MAIETFNYPIFGIRQKQGKNKKTTKILRENDVAALKTISYENNRYIQLRIL